MYWQEYYNPNNYSTGWSIFDAAPFKWWGYEVVWTLAWSGIALLNIIFKIAGLDSLFNGIAVASILGPLGSIGLLGYANYTGDRFTKRTSSSDPGKWLATVSTLVAS